MNDHIDKKEIKKRWSSEYKELERIVNEWDPVNLIGGGAPEDEYDCLTTKLLSLLHNDADLKKLTTFVYSELDEHFGQSIESIKLEYREKYVKYINEYCKKIFNWFNMREC